ncbi:MAG: multicopper oxidase family protein [Gemmatimonadaceae bacterium]
MAFRGRLSRLVRPAAYAAILLAGSELAAQGPPPGWRDPRCAMDAAPFATPFCAELVATPDIDGVRGMLELRSIPSPFGVAVRPDGQLRHFLVSRFTGLPAPQSLGRYTVFVAWGYDLTHAREVKLGVVSNGTTALGELPFEYFRILISAESSVAVRTRTGRLVARATSPGALMLAHRDALTPMMGGGGSANPHAGHDVGWPMPPNDPRIAPSAMGHAPPTTAPWLPDTTGRPVVDARPREVRDVKSGDTLTLVASLVRRTIAGRTFIMYGYNGQYPGPLIRVGQGAEVTVKFRNAIDLPTTVHWHGLRLENANDGVPHVTQEPVAPGDSFTYRLRFPDAGIYWYHPHVREDIEQAMGLVGNMRVDSPEKDYYSPVNREQTLMLDDVLINADTLIPFGREAPTFALMGRVGNVLMVNGEPRYALRVRTGDVVRFFVTNVSSSRTWNLSFGGAPIKVVASDLSRFEREARVPSVVIAPAERYVVEVRFDRPGRVAMINAIQAINHFEGEFEPQVDTLGVVTVDPAPASPTYAKQFATLRANTAVARDIDRYRQYFDRPPDQSLTLTVATNALPLATVQFMNVDTAYFAPVEWVDGMPDMNWLSTARQVRWILRDDATGKENMDIDWRVKTGAVVKLRIFNDPKSFHPMQHPIHLHGQRMLVVSRDGVPTKNMAWKDTALIPVGSTVDLLIDASNPGVWMLHCHIAEHLGSGMMATMHVGPASSR